MGILLAKMADVLDYDRSTSTDAGNVIVASGDAYYAFIGNDILDMQHFSDENAGNTEKTVYASFSAYKEQLVNDLISIMENESAPAYKDMSRETQAYLSFIVTDLLTESRGVLVQESINTEDAAVYLQWRNEETININTYLNYAISQN